MRDHGRGTSSVATATARLPWLMLHAGGSLAVGHGLAEERSHHASVINGRDAWWYGLWDLLFAGFQAVWVLESRTKVGVRYSEAT